MHEHIFEIQDKWLSALIERWSQAIGGILNQRGQLNILLCGGNTPRPFYQRLAKLEWPWEATRFFIGDERWVPITHKESNYRMIYEAFYPHRIQLERWKTEMLRPELAAADYQKRLVFQLGNPPRFDLALLGIGEDGHTASLFPNTDALLEEKAWVVANRIPQLGTFRLTVTYPLLFHAQEIWFLAQGAAKQPWIDKMHIGDPDVLSSFPAGRVKAKENNIHLFYSRA